MPTGASTANACSQVYYQDPEAVCKDLFKWIYIGIQKFEAIFCWFQTIYYQRLQHCSCINSTGSHLMNMFSSLLWEPLVPKWKQEHLIIYTESDMIKVTNLLIWIVQNPKFIFYVILCHNISWLINVFKILKLFRSGVHNSGPQDLLFCRV